MKFIATCLFTFIFAVSVSAQTVTQILAKANGQNYTAADLPADLRESYLKLAKNSLDARRVLFNNQLAEILLETEAKVRKISVDDLIKTVTSKVANPTEKQIQDVYDKNRDALGGRSLEQVREQIIAFLRSDGEQRALSVFVMSLGKKYKALIFKDVNARALKPADILATVNGRNITAAAFETKNRVALYEQKADVFDDVKLALEEKIYDALVVAEAKSQKIDASDLIAREISDKLRDFTDDERESLEADFRRKLFTKYNVQFFLKEPAPLVLPISVDDDPSRGSATAPVTVVMFSDFQCSVCAATHPVLQRVLAEYTSEQVRFVVRDFPLEQIHENAFLAATAANAAHKQGKFFEFTEVLYRNQNALDKESLKKYATDLGLNLAQFELDLQSAPNAAEIRKDMADGETYGINGTPTIYVNGVKVRRNNAEYFRAAIDKVLKK
ncbi:MAG TPA: thioredoxin domain-containing protein [Pyrinomonadaceae bacterium]|mgnify:CR=1 FL=1|nr:thioredoxin domain-containing protein [Pyrinomonadaceae bacterium]